MEELADKFVKSAQIDETPQSDHVSLLFIRFSKHFKGVHYVTIIYCGSN